MVGRIPDVDLGIRGANVAADIQRKEQLAETVCERHGFTIEWVRLPNACPSDVFPTCNCRNFHGDRYRAIIGKPGFAFSPFSMIFWNLPTNPPINKYVILRMIQLIRNANYTDINQVVRNMGWPQTEAGRKAARAVMSNKEALNDFFSRDELDSIYDLYIAR